MLIKKTITFLLIIFSSFCMIGCHKNKKELYAENQAFYNRLILDYWEQKFNKNGAVIQSRSCLTNIVNDDDIWYKYPNNNGANVTIDDLSVSIKGSNKKGAYTCFFSSNLCSPTSGYQMAYNHFLFVDGEVINYFMTDYLPFVWYQGTVLFINEAYRLGIISLDEIDNRENDNNFYLGYKKWDKNSEPLTIKERYQINDKDYISLQTSCLSFIDKNEVKPIAGCNNVESHDIHIVDSFGKYSEKEILMIGIDGVYAADYAERWKEDLEFDNQTLHRFYQFIPLVYYDNEIIDFVFAYNNGILLKNDIEAIEAKYGSLLITDFS